MSDATPKPTARAPMPAAGARRPGMGLLAGKPSGSTPIPPSMQAKMAALANRGPASPSGSGTPGAPAMPGMPRGPAGLAARRARPGGLQLSAMDGAIPASIGPSGGGLGRGIPQEQPGQLRPNVAETPFSALSNIVYVISALIGV